MAVVAIAAMARAQRQALAAPKRPA